MSASESFRGWKTEMWPSGGYELDSLTDDQSGLRIVLNCHPEKGAASRYEISFVRPRAYRSIAESFRIKQWDSEWLATRLREPSVVYVVENSSFLADFHERSMHVMEDADLTHYFIVTNNDCIDVIADIEPEVRALSAAEGAS